MLDLRQFEQWCSKVGLGEKARRVVDLIRSSSPTQAVRSGLRNVRGRYPSSKMGCTIQFESHTLELARIYELEHDPGILEYYDKPTSMELAYRTASGRSVKTKHVPSFFVLSIEGAWWEDCKPEVRLQKTSRTSPDRYRFEQGRWVCPPAEAFAAEVGLSYRVTSSTAIKWVFQRNLRFLSDYLADSGATVSNEVRGEVLSLVPEALPISLESLLASTRLATSDDVYRLLATGEIYVDLYAVALATPQRVSVFQSAEAASVHHRGSLVPRSGVLFAPGKRLEWDEQPWTVANVGKSGVAIVDGSGRLVTLDHATAELQAKSGAIRSASAEDVSRPRSSDVIPEGHPDDLRVALDRLAIIDEYIATGTCGGFARRTVQEWLSRYRRAQLKGSTGLEGLLPSIRQRGNRNRKLPRETLELLDELVHTQYETSQRMSIRRLHEAVIAESAMRGLTAPSYKAVIEAIRRRRGPQQTRKREGKRAAYSVTPFYWTLEATTPRHGDRPFEIVHSDHTELDVELVDSQTGVNLGRPWATICTDAFSRRLLSVILIFEPPSYRSCMLALRELVERHNRFPESMVVDGGKEFNSVYFEALLARYRCTKKSRAAGAPRFGSVCERLFGTTNTEFIHTLIGNTQIVRRPRSAVGADLPARHAVWSLPELTQYLCTWSYEIYDVRPHPALGQSPREAFTDALNRTGKRPGRIVAYDDDFRVATMPSTPKGTARVVPGRGIQIRQIFYWSVGDEFRSPSACGKDVPVRYDPADVGTAYAFIGTRWVRCVSDHYSILQGRSESEIKLASAEILQQHGVARRRTREEYVRRLTEFLQSAHAAEVLAMQRLRDQETRRSRSHQSRKGATETDDAESKPSVERRDRRRPKRRAQHSKIHLTEFGTY
jgi:hypothetical protein